MNLMRTTPRWAWLILLALCTTASAALPIRHQYSGTDSKAPRKSAPSSVLDGKNLPRSTPHSVSPSASPGKSKGTRGELDRLEHQGAGRPHTSVRRQPRSGTTRATTSPTVSSGHKSPINFRYHAPSSGRSSPSASGNRRH